jgi:hypothetical protein
LATNARPTSKRSAAIATNLSASNKERARSSPSATPKLVTAATLPGDLLGVADQDLDDDGYDADELAEG